MFKVSKSNQLLLTVFVKPSSKIKRTEAVIKVDDLGLFVRLKAQPTKGKANKELISCLANLFELKSSQISIIQGLSSTTKIIALKGISLPKASEKLFKFQQAQKTQ